MGSWVGFEIRFEVETSHEAVQAYLLRFRASLKAKHSDMGQNWSQKQDVSIHNLQNDPKRLNPRPANPKGIDGIGAKRPKLQTLNPKRPNAIESQPKPQT